MTVTILTCNRCGYEWARHPGATRDPKNCSRCKSPYYNKPRQRPPTVMSRRDKQLATLRALCPQVTED